MVPLLIVTFSWIEPDVVWGEAEGKRAKQLGTRQILSYSHAERSFRALSLRKRACGHRA